MSEADPNSKRERVEKRRKPARDGKLADEIRIVRAMIRQAETMTDAADSSEKLLRSLEIVSHASAHLATLLKTEKALDENQTAAEYVKAALDEIRAEMERKEIDSILTSGL
jgi:hypothetical protein